MDRCRPRRDRRCAALAVRADPYFDFLCPLHPGARGHPRQPRARTSEAALAERPGRLGRRAWPGFNWPILMRGHALHHAHTNTDQDPDLEVRARSPSCWSNGCCSFRALIPLSLRWFVPAQYRKLSEAARRDAASLGRGLGSPKLFVVSFTMCWLAAAALPSDAAGRPVPADLLLVAAAPPVRPVGAVSQHPHQPLAGRASSRCSRTFI